jgi:hypothetical protein
MDVVCASFGLFPFLRSFVLSFFLGDWGSLGAFWTDLS